MAEIIVHVYHYGGAKSEIYFKNEVLSTPIYNEFCYVNRLGVGDILCGISKLTAFSHCAHTWVTLRFLRFGYCIMSSTLSSTSTLSFVLTISTTLAPCLWDTEWDNANKRNNTFLVFWAPKISASPPIPICEN